MLNLLHNASKEFDVPGNLFLATSRESITETLSINSFLIASNSLFKKLRSRSLSKVQQLFDLVCPDYRLSLTRPDPN